MTVSLAIVYTFAISNASSQEELVYSSADVCPVTMDPLEAAGNFRSVFYLYGREVSFHSHCGPIVLSADDENGTFSSTRPGIVGLPRALARLCDLKEDSSAENNIYHSLVRTLTPLLLLDSSAEDFTVLIAFIGRNWSMLKPLLLQRDSRALLLLAYWFGQIGQIGQWWIEDRARSECRAIVRHLSLLEDVELTDLLGFPAAFGAGDDIAAQACLRDVTADVIPAE
jgi:hypothetical protein